MASYTIWSGDRLLGETDLGWVRCMPKVRSGFFHPTELGTRFMPTICGVSPAMREVFRLRRVIEGDDQADGASFRALERTPEYADMLEAIQHELGLALMLRGPDGCLIATEHIFIQDNEYLLSLADEADESEMFESRWDETLDPELEGSIAHDIELLFGSGDVDDWESDDWAPEGAKAPFPRYQIHVRLIRNGDVP